MFSYFDSHTSFRCFSVSFQKFMNFQMQLRCYAKSTTKGMVLRSVSSISLQLLREKKTYPIAMVGVGLALCNCKDNWCYPLLPRLMEFNELKVPIKEKYFV